MKTDWRSLLFFLILIFSIEFLAAWWTNQSVKSWYPLLIKPSWTPPNWLFAPVWTILYTLIAVAGWMIYRINSHPDRAKALLFYSFQLFLNLIWSALFFWMKNPLAGLIDLFALWILLILTIFYFWKIKPLAAFLLVPYFLWTTYALALNFSIWTLNPIK